MICSNPVTPPKESDWPRHPGSHLQAHRGHRLSVAEDPQQKIVLVNPEIIHKEGTQAGEEGCLSLPGFREQVTVPKKVTVRAQNVKGETFEMTGEDLLARAFNHEIDHLNGRLYITHVSALNRDLIRRARSGNWPRPANGAAPSDAGILDCVPAMNLIFLGTPSFAVPTLEAIVAGRPSRAGGLHTADRPKGRGGQVAASPVKEAALRHGLAVHQPERIRRPEVVEQLKQLNPDAMVVVGYGQIIPQSIIDIPRHGIINVHGSLLPKYRGAAPIQWAIADGEKRTGVTTMRIDAGARHGRHAAEVGDRNRAGRKMRWSLASVWRSRALSFWFERSAKIQRL